MIIKFILIMLATFLTCMFYFAAALTAVKSLQPVRVVKDKGERNGQQR